MDKTYDHQISETKARLLWEEFNAYSLENNPGPQYSIDTPPPTVSGSLHIGHIFSYTQTDIITRYARMQGNSVFYPFGFDDNGLPTEKFVEKKLNIQAHEMKRSEFIDICLKETALVEKQFELLWRKIGLSVDWKACYSTIDDRTRFISQQSFIKLFKQGHIYRKDEPALYCTTCRTTVAQAELDDLEKETTFNELKFKVAEQEIIIATTRPELLAAVNAVFFNPHDARFSGLKGKKAVVPYYNFEVPILPDELVDPEKGTGLVMSSTFGDKTDVTWYKTYRLPYKPIIGLDGKLSAETGILEGMRVPTARKTILEALEKEGSLVSKKPYAQSVNVHERCKKEIEYLILPQWFLAILDHKETFIELGNRIAWYPSFMKTRYENWVQNISWDWCLSRQRFFGIPFPVWHCTQCKEIILANEKDLPLDPQETHYNGSCACGSTSFIPDTDVMDTWNTSSLTPYICASIGKPESTDIFNDSVDFIPMALRPQAHDIIRTWAFYTIIKTWLHSKTIPWKHIVISGHVLSNEKEKISKSQGNTPLSPESLLEKYPADALRYWTASGSLGYDIAFSENRIDIGRKLLVKLWNAFRFLQPHVQNVDLNSPPKHFFVANEWLLTSATMCTSSYTHYFKDHEFSLSLTTTEHFFWNDFCDNYLEIIKDQLLNPENFTADELYATRWTLAHVGIRILQLYAPFVPHITEMIYQMIYKDLVGIPSLHLTKYEQFQSTYNFQESAVLMQGVLLIISSVRKLKSEAQLSLKTDIAVLTISCSNNDFLEKLKTLTPLIKGVTRALTMEYTSQSLNTELHAIQDLWHATVLL